MSSGALAFVVVLLIGLTACIQLRTHTHIAVLNTAIERQNKALDEMDKTYKDMSASLDEIKNSDEIMKKAKFQLGMVYPDDGQVKYIDVTVRDEENDVNENVYLNPVISVLHIFNGK
ncbi:MAG: hypothetical protein SPI65_02075 [Peptoniphilus sp.]|nr:hypothetical protein [Peptoniphilus sp.]MDD7363130.1 hypothetical protein [Bacillota bacterium]MDY6044348.1 hypothetical protein [Peptoniphilus sp.]